MSATIPSPKPQGWLRLLTLLLVAPLALGAFAVSRGRSKLDTDTGTAPINFGKLVATVMQASSNSTGAEYVTLRATGFEPAEFSRPAGPFLLAIDNRSQKGEMSFLILRENGLHERELPRRRQRFRLRQVIDLAPGRYLLVVMNHPEWVCRITITAQ